MKYNIKIDYTKDELLKCNSSHPDFAIDTLIERYMLPTEASPQDAFARASSAYADDEAHAQRMYGYVSNLWMAFSSPILSNGGTEKGQPISCFLNEPDDSREGLDYHFKENIFLASGGGGIGGYWGNIRSNGTSTSKGSKSNGVAPFMRIVDAYMSAFSQGGTRRGSYAAYLDVSHPEIEEFISIRKPTGGDINRKCLSTGFHHAVNIPDSFMKLVEGKMKDHTFNDSWGLVDPHTKEVRSVVSASSLWKKIIETRMSTGEPYIHYIDTTRRLQPECHKALGLEVNTSNLCSEIVLPTNQERTAVCVLSSVNLEYYDEWKDTSMVADLTRFLDNVISSFVANAPDQWAKAKYSASRERSLGIGAMGFHSFLQSKLIPFESASAIAYTRSMFNNLRKQAEAATEQLGKERGNAPDYTEGRILSQGVREIEGGIPLSTEGFRRNVHLIAVAPNASSSIYCGNTSPSVEPLRANCYKQKTLTGTAINRNKYLDNLFDMRYKDKNKAKLWKSILEHNGSVQHLAFLTQEERDVFKTAPEIDQLWIVDHAGHRQTYIDQAQSINLFFPSDAHVVDLHNAHFAAWKKGLKTLYYLRNETVAKVENMNVKVERKVMEEEGCLSCE